MIVYLLSVFVAGQLVMKPMVLPDHSACVDTGGALVEMVKKIIPDPEGKLTWTCEPTIGSSQFNRR